MKNTPVQNINDPQSHNGWGHQLMCTFIGRMLPIYMIHRLLPLAY